MKGYLPEGSKESALTVSPPSFTLSALERAMERGNILEAPAILCDSDMNLHVALGEFIGIIPKEEVAYHPKNFPTKEIAILTRVGKMVNFRVKQITRKDGKVHVLLSRRDAQKECFLKYISTLCAGDVIRAKVTHMESFGVLVELRSHVLSFDGCKGTYFF